MSFDYQVDRQADPFVSRVLAAKNTGHIPDTVDPETCSAETLKSFADLAARNDQREIDRATNIENGKGFIAAHKEWLPSEANISLMNHEMSRTFGDGLYTPANYEAAYQSLRASNFLALDKTEDAKRQKAEAKQRHETELARSQPHTIEQMYLLDMSELRRLGGGGRGF